jgi:hypothetical protein
MSLKWKYDPFKSYIKESQFCYSCMNLTLKKIEQRLDTLLHKNGLGVSDTSHDDANVSITWGSIWVRATQLETDFRNADRHGDDWYIDYLITTNSIALWVRDSIGNYPNTKVWAQNWLTGTVALITGIEGLKTAPADGLET